MNPVIKICLYTSFTAFVFDFSEFALNKLVIDDKYESWFENTLIFALLDIFVFFILSFGTVQILYIVKPNGFDFFNDIFIPFISFFLFIFLLWVILPYLFMGIHNPHKTFLFYLNESIEFVFRNSVVFAGWYHFYSRKI